MAYKKRSERKHRSFGGMAEKNEHQYNAQGSPEEKSEHAKSEGFKRGGHAHRKHGGNVEGEGAKHHMGHMKRAHGGAVRHKGGAPFSTARAKSGPGNGKGSPGEQAPVEP